MTTKFYDDEGYDEEGFNASGMNRWGEVSPSKSEMNLDKEDILFSCRTAAGRRFIWRILSFCGIFGDFDRVQTERDDQRQIGRRTVGLYIMGILEEADPEIILSIMNENHRMNKEKENARRNYT